MLLKGAHDKVVISLAGAEPKINFGINTLQPRSLNKPYKPPITKGKTSPQFSYMNKSPLLPKKTFTSTKSYTPSYKRSSSIQYQPTQSYTNSSSKAKPSLPQSVTESTTARTLVRSVTAPSTFARTELRDRIQEEIPQLLKDIRRIGTAGEPEVKFGELFDDEEVEQYYEALVGTLKSAKKRGYISFKGQMLLKGMHDNVLISIQKEF